MISRKTVRTTLLTIGLTLTAWSAPLRAEEPADATPPAQTKTEAARAAATAALDRFKTAVDGLKLTDDQMKEATEYFDAAKKEIAALEAKADPKELKTKAQNILEKLRADMNHVLTNEQKLQIQKKLQAASAGSMVIDKIKQQLEKPEFKLTDEQRMKVDEILDDTKKKLQDLKEASQKGEKNLAPKIKETLKDMHDRLITVLSPEQLKQLQPNSKPEPKTDK